MNNITRSVTITHHRSWLLLSGLMIAPAFLLAEDAVTEQSRSIESRPLPSISARHIRWHEPTEIVLIRSDIELSPVGFRVRKAEQGERHNEMLQDFINDEAWLIDRKRRMAHRLPLQNEGHLDMAKPGDEASFLSQTPCGHSLTPESAGEGRWRGREVSTWYCKNATGETVSLEFVDHIYGIVVFSRTLDGKTDELKNLQERDYTENHFRPDEELRLVGRQEFFGGVPAIQRYEEPEQNMD